MVNRSDQRGSSHGRQVAEVLFSRYLRTVISIEVVAAAVGHLGGRYLPAPLAVLTMIGAVAAAAAAPLIVPIDPPREDTRP